MVDIPHSNNFSEVTLSKQFSEEITNLSLVVFISRGIQSEVICYLDNFRIIIS